jgi:NAD(P)-dependent dehydrogenase (short-subunit alcohol dehydrogenase family)
MGLERRTAVISGGASGIGAAVVRAFVRTGAATVLIDRNEKAGRALSEELANAGECLFVHGDVSNEQDCLKTIEQADSKYGPVHHLVNNAALFLYRSLEATPAEWASILNVNVVGTSLLSRFAVQSMRRLSRGTIVNISSISAVLAQPGTMTYNATKAALLEMTRCMALDLSPYSIRVNCVCPGYTRTSAYENYVAESGRPPDEVDKEMSSRTILKRLGSPEEIANCVLFLSSEESSYVTGTALMVDGGLTSF